MDWWMIEYDNKDSDSHVFEKKIMDEFDGLRPVGGSPAGWGLYCNHEVSPDNMLRFYVNPEGARIPLVLDLLQRYGAKECSKPTEPCDLLVGDRAEILNGEESGE